MDFARPSTQKSHILLVSQPGILGLVVLDQCHALKMVEVPDLLASESELHNCDHVHRERQIFHVQGDHLDAFNRLMSDLVCGCKNKHKERKGGAERDISSSGMKFEVYRAEIDERLEAEASVDLGWCLYDMTDMCDFMNL